MMTIITAIGVWILVGVLVCAIYSKIAVANRRQRKTWLEFCLNVKIVTNVFKDKLIYKPAEMTLSEFLSTEEIKTWLKDYDISIREFRDTYRITLRTPEFEGEFLVDRNLFPA